jgi:transcriptional regulator with XRE-family HTH domain
MTVKLSDLRTAAQVREEDMRDPEYRREYERTKLANDVALQVLTYRAEHGMTQTGLARLLGMRQPNIARLESGEHEPSLSTLARLSSVLGIDFSVDITPGGACLAAPRATVSARGRERAGIALAGAASAPSAVLTKAPRRTASPGRDQKAAHLRDLERLRELIRPYSTDTSAPIARAIARMPAEGQAEARDILARLGTTGEDPEKAAARQQILLDIAEAETALRDLLGRPHYKIRDGRIVTDPGTGEPVPDRKTEREARALLAEMDRIRTRLTGLPPRDDVPGAAE